MTTYNILIEGQTIPVSEDIGANDATVKAALTPFYPDAANAMITRVEKDDVVTINVVKRAGTKGLAPAPAQIAGHPGPLAYLDTCPSHKNPAIEMYEQIYTSPAFSPEELLILDARLQAAIEEGVAQGRMLEAALTRLNDARPQPAPAVIIGF
ncbi:MAG: hypothetical protein C4575_12750 [Desulforudis sp.]|jgi:hypothetical protein|nr:MAG: hypothetical protein C4575_12750 [Desulforudis sp.]